MDHEISAAIDRAGKRMGPQFTGNQVLGRKLALGCAAVEITQRCNLDCTLCYLSEHSESVRDIPIEEVYRRLDEVRRQYGPKTHVQITGGDPTLRKHHELIAIVRYARRAGLYPALFTNGIAATRQLLRQLANAGLCDVAFHVDTTQQRHGYETEADLNTLRLEYIQRSRGLGLMVIFNTTVHQGNYLQLPGLVRFFVRNADVIGLVSFQLQADTGRGAWGKRNAVISLETVRNRIDSACGRRLPWDMVQVGHPRCHSYMPALVVNDHVYPLIENQQWYNDFLDDFSGVNADRHSSIPGFCLQYLYKLSISPKWWYRACTCLFRHIRRAGADLFKARGKVHKLSIFIHNFMDADNLDQERIDACSFMIMTAEGPVSMCAHNANRDAYILKPVTVTRRDGTTMVFQPLKNKVRQSR